MPHPPCVCNCLQRLLLEEELKDVTVPLCAAAAYYVHRLTITSPPWLGDGSARRAARLESKLMSTSRNKIVRRIKTDIELV